MLRNWLTVWLAFNAVRRLGAERMWLHNDAGILGLIFTINAWYRHLTSYLYTINLVKYYNLAANSFATAGEIRRFYTGGDIGQETWICVPSPN